MASERPDPLASQTGRPAEGRTTRPLGEGAERVQITDPAEAQVRAVEILAPNLETATEFASALRDNASSLVSALERAQAGISAYAAELGAQAPFRDGSDYNMHVATTLSAEQAEGIPAAIGDVRL